MAGSFALDISKFVEKAKGNARVVAKKIVLDVGNRIIEKTPVGDPTTWKHPPPAGYVGGRARGSWAYGFNATPQPADMVDESGKVSMTRIRAGVASNDGIGAHFITNGLPYIRRLEYDGWSRQAPAGMVRVTIQEYQQVIDAAVRGLP